MLGDANRCKLDVVMASAIDRVERSLIDLLGTMQHLEACGVDLDQQNIDTTTSIGRLAFQVTGAKVAARKGQALDHPVSAE
jgi:DNA invertase Pin-like site-specific DNA recombinase